MPVTPLEKQLADALRGLLEAYKQCDELLFSLGYLNDDQTALNDAQEALDEFSHKGLS